MANDYKSTVFLPRSDFPMKGNLPAREPEILERWRQMGLYHRLRENAAGRDKFILHDGPPYANGHLHIGHALNKILKDVINRSQQMLGLDAIYVPGWDCHGLPIEWKIEEKYRAAGKDKDEVPIDQFRRECREFAEQWIDIQREEFRRLGVEGDWDNPYTTMSPNAEAQIVREVGKFLMNGALYRGARPVLWSVVEKTALADAEVEYHDHRSTTAYARFPILTSPNPVLGGASVVIWTTTPWTIPGNRAIVYGPNFEYELVEVRKVADAARARVGEQLLIAVGLREAFATEAGIEHAVRVAAVNGRDLAGTVCRHPLRGRGYDFDVPLLPGDHVTLDQGTGLVHTAPGHGAEDFEIGVTHGLEVPETVGEDGRFLEHVPLFGGRRVLTADGEPGDADAAVVAALAEGDALLADGDLVHSYPHSWRSKAPLIFRNTPQWFISMSATGLREKSLAAIDATRWVPAAGRNRIYAMVENRPDWCVSRQRAWGVPLPVFIHRTSGEPLRDQRVIDRIAAVVEAEGADAWYSSEPGRFLGNEHDPKEYEQVQDIVEVWFESGSTHSFVLEARPDLEWPASLYIEGSDQHRGWFHTSLLEACGTRGRAPFETVLTHGFVMDEQGRKMSKSLGNVVAPQDIVERYGAEILRLWVAGSDYFEDLRIGPEIIRYQIDLYRRLRNTLRYLLGNLTDFNEAERIMPAEMPPLERWVLHRLYELDVLVRRCCEEFDYHTLFSSLHHFCTVDLSAFYFDVRKDVLYCEHLASPARCAARSVLDHIFNCLTAWLAPILCFTAEEAWLIRNGDGDSVHLRKFPDVPPEWRDETLAESWVKVRALRRAVTGALEIERENKRIGSSLEAHVMIYADAEYRRAMADVTADGADMAELFITSGANFAPGDGPAPEGPVDPSADVVGVGVVVRKADGEKCQRCWRILPDTGSDPRYDDICVRCANVVGRLAAGN